MKTSRDTTPLLGALSVRVRSAMMDGIMRRRADEARMVVGAARFLDAKRARGQGGCAAWLRGSSESAPHAATRWRAAHHQATPHSRGVTPLDSTEFDGMKPSNLWMMVLRYVYVQCLFVRTIPVGCTFGGTSASCRAEMLSGSPLTMRCQRVERLLCERNCKTAERPRSPVSKVAP